MLLLLLLLLLGLIWTHQSFGFKNGLSGTRDWKKTVAFSEKRDYPSLDDFLNKKNRKWSGRTDILERRKQLPSVDQSPTDVVRIVLAALKINDDPQMDHGACVLLEFSNPKGILREGKLDPGELGSFLREKYSVLIDFKRAELVGDPSETEPFSVTQRVKILDWDTNNTAGTNFDFFLSRVPGKSWLIDVIVRVV